MGARPLRLFSWSTLRWGGRGRPGTVSPLEAPRYRTLAALLDPPRHPNCALLINRTTAPTSTAGHELGLAEWLRCLRTFWSGPMAIVETRSLPCFYFHLG